MSWQEYQNGYSYQETIGLRKRIAESIKFYEGDQWAKITEKTKTMPRPVVNICKLICRAKQSAILATPAKLVFNSVKNPDMAQKATRFLEYISKEMSINKYDEEAVNEGLTKGTAVYHFYWDTDQNGVRCELIDPRNVFVSNPKEHDEQAQKWIIISSREEVSSVKARADKKYLENVSVDTEDDYVEEQEGTELCTVLTKYYRQDGEVFCELSTQRGIIREPFAISPNINEALSEIEEAPDKLSSEITEGYKAKLFPIVIWSYEKKDNSIYGMSEVETIIPNQKAINFQLAMQLLATENAAWAKYIVKSDALQGQIITNEPGQVIVDHSVQGRGIDRMQGQAPSTMSLELVGTITNLTRMVTGATEVTTGEVMGANMSGAAIAQLQAQAQQPIATLRKRFWDAKERQGKILEQFFRMYYYNKDFYYETEEEKVSEVFNSSDIANVDLYMAVEATAGTRASVATDLAILDNLLLNKHIGAEEYIEAIPDSVLSDKTRLRNLIRKRKENDLLQAQEIIKQMSQKIEESAGLIERQTSVIANIVPVIQENNRLKASLAQLYKESIDKINASEIRAQETEADATEFAQVLMEQLNGMSNL
jgi:hypothetical protein